LINNLNLNFAANTYIRYVDNEDIDNGKESALHKFPDNEKGYLVYTDEPNEDPLSYYIKILTWVVGRYACIFIALTLLLVLFITLLMIS